MKRLLLISLVSLLFPLVASAYDVEIDGIYYNVVKKAKQATVTPGDNKYTGSVVIPATVDFDGVTCNVIAIDDYAFRDCRGLTSVTIPNSVTSIGVWAFDGCLGLTAVHISDIAAWCKISFESVYANPLYYAYHLYLNGEEVKDLVVPNSVTSIGARAFYGCSSLTSVTIPNSVTSIGEGAFKNCSLTSITIPNSVTTIGGYAFQNCSGLTSVHISDIAAWCKISFEGNEGYYANPLVYAHHLYMDGEEVKDMVIPNSVTSIGNYAFYGCSDLTSVTIPNSVTSIGGYAFYGCSDLTSVTIPNSVTSIGYSAFSGCSGLASVTIPNSVTSIGGYAFNSCSGLTSITIGNGVTSIGNYAFYGCTSLTSVHISDIAAWCEISFSYAEANPLYYAHHLYVNGEEVKDLVVPNSVTSIGARAFYGCASLTSIDIPYSVTNIGNDAFCNCSELTTVTIGYGINSIYNYAFANCEELTDFYCYAESVPYTITAAFENSLIEYATLHVPAASVDLYKAKAPWKDFGNIVSIQIDGEQPADEVTLTANSYSRAYGEANPTFGYTVTEGTITSGTPTISCDATATSPVGTYDIVIAKGTVSNNTVSLVKGTLTITKAPLTVSAGNYTKVEGEDNPVFTPTYSGFKNGETAAVLTKQPVITTTATKTSTAGIYPVTVSGAEAQNYSFNYQNGTLTVTSQSVVQKDNIQFADAKVKAICVANWDTDHDGELSKQEAVAVTSIGTVFSEEWEITSFDELQYFTGLTAIDDNAFAGCDGLTSITLPNTVTSLGTYAFSGCDGLTSFVIPSSVTTLNDAVFNYCVGLTSIIIPKSVTRMGFNPLNGCSALTSIQVESGNPNFDSRNGCNAIIYGKSDILVSGCKNTVIPDGIKTIWQYAFGGCEELTSITIPASVTTFGNYAFFGCDNLEEIHSEIVQPSAINATVFGNTDIFTTATLYVPAGTKAQYQATDGWKDFRNIVEQGGTATVAGEVVDLGLAVKWADRNLGATDMTSTGTYFAWGDTEARTSYDELHYVFNGGNLSQDIIGTEYDAARQLWGGEWRMPTYEEVEELMSQCTWTYTTRNGVNGYLVESLVNDHYIFLPTPGYKEGTTINSSSTYYWTGNQPADNKSLAMSLTGNGKDVRDIRQYLGALIRPVYGEIFHYVPTPSNIEELIVRDVTVTSATVNVAISGDLNDVDLLGLTYGKSAEELTISDKNDANHKVTSEISARPFFYFTALDANTTYYVRAYMKKTDGSYVESETVSFKTLMDMSDFVSLIAKSYTREYGEENPEFEYEVTEGTALGTPTLSCDATKWSSVGEYVIAINTSTMSNSVVETTTGTLTIVPKGIATATLTVADSCVYTGQPIRPDVTVQLDGRVLTEGTDYILTFTNNFMPGIASLTIMGVDNYTGSVTKTFVIFNPQPTVDDLLPDEGDNNGASDYSSGESGVNESTDLNEKVVGNVYYCITPDAGGYDAEEGCLVINKAATTVSTELPAVDGQLPSASNGFRGLVFFVNASRGKVKIKAETTGNLLLCVKIAGELVMSMAVEGKTTLTIPYDVSQPSEVLVYAGFAASSRSMASSTTEDALKIYSLEWESEPTAIGVDKIENGKLKIENYYDLNGRKVNVQLKKGVYIVGGRKRVVK